MVALIQIGVDVGQRIDPTAIVVAQLSEETDGWHYTARHIEKVLLDTSYPAIVKRLLEIYASLKKQQQREFMEDERKRLDESPWDGYRTFKFRAPEMFVDATGVGQPVVDMLREAGLKPTAVYLTAGHQETREQGEIHLPKNLLVSNLQVLLQNKRCHLPDTPESAALVEELLNYEIKVTESQNLKMGVFTIGKHDDLATALGLACRPRIDRSLKSFPMPESLTLAGARQTSSAGYGRSTQELRARYHKNRPR